ncbi:MAG: hypothetical protein J5680_04820 [Neisseriaceae bacterium]|nr:hypothetical protein [Neisseriaceae bacterium]
MFDKFFRQPESTSRAGKLLLRNAVGWATCCPRVFSGSLKSFCIASVFRIGYLKIIFNFVSLVKNNFQRLPRLTLVRLAMTSRAA